VRALLFFFEYLERLRAARSAESKNGSFRDGALLFGRPGDCGVVVGLCLGDVGTCTCRVVLRLVERLLRGGLAVRQGVGAVELLLRVFQPRFCLCDFGCQRSDLLRPHAGMDVVAVGDITGPDAISLPHLDRRELTADLSIIDRCDWKSTSPRHDPALTLSLVNRIEP